MNVRKMTAVVLATTSILGQAFAGDKIVCEGSSTVGPLAKAFAEYYMEANPTTAITVSESGSGNGAKAIVEGTCDVADMSRNMKNKEFKSAVDKGIMPCPHVIALDGLAVVVHKSNPVKGLTLTQLKDIYLGKITNWKTLGGTNRKIIVITRDTNSGTFETFAKLVMNKEVIDSGVEVVGSNGQARSRVSTTKDAIAYVGLGFMEGLKPVAINGTLPSADTVRNGSYAIARPLFMYTNGYPKIGSELHKFMSIYLSEDGQEIIEEIGFVPVTNY